MFFIDALLSCAKPGNNLTVEEVWLCISGIVRDAADRMGNSQTPKRGRTLDEISGGR